MHGVRQLRLRHGLGNTGDFLRRGNTVLIDLNDSEFLQIIQNHQIGAKARGDRAQIAQAVETGRLKGSAANRCDRVEPQADGFANVMVNMPLALDIIQMQIIGAERKAVKRQAIF